MAGYDSDDGPCFDAIAKEGVQDFDEDEVTTIVAPAATAAIQETTVQLVIGQFIDNEDSVLNNVKLNELKQALLIRERMEVADGKLTPSCMSQASFGRRCCCCC